MGVSLCPLQYQLPALPGLSYGFRKFRYAGCHLCLLKPRNLEIGFLFPAFLVLFRQLEQNTVNLVTYQQQKFLMLLEAGQFKIQISTDLVFGESPLPGSLIVVFSLCPYMVEGTKDLSGVSFLRALIPSTRAPPL